MSRLPTNDGNRLGVLSVECASAFIAGYTHPERRPVYHVLHERENYPLVYWYTLNPAAIQPADGRCHPDQFDIRDSELDWIPNPGVRA